MAEFQKTVFISYRRSASNYAARAVYEYLTNAGFDVFLDYTSIASGDFAEIILKQIAARAHFLVLLAPGTLERASEPDDWVRREIEHAIDTERNIVPLFFDGFSFSDFENYLTGKLEVLQRFNGINIPSAYFNEAMERLVTRFLNPSSNVQQVLSLSNVISPEQPPIDSIAGDDLAEVDTSDDETQSILYLLEGVYFFTELHDVEKARDRFDKAIVLNDSFADEIDRLRERQQARKHVFLSYSRKNIDFMKRIKNTLEDEGYLIWTDENLSPGTPLWEQEIGTAIEASMSLIVLLSPFAKSSPWVTREIGYARTHRVPIYPLLIEGDEATSIPFGLIGSQYVDVTSKYVSGMAKLIAELGKSSAK